MTILQETLDALAAVSDGIDNIQTISEAIKSGKDYLTSKHPDAAADLAVMCEEMRKSSQALASASSIITHFRFVIGDTLSEEASRFNRNLIEHKAQAEMVEQSLQSMRGHCSVIEKHATAIQEKVEPRGLTSLAAVLGLHSAEREQEVASALGGIYAGEMEYHQGVTMMAQAIKTTLDAVQNELGPAGVIDPANVPNAATVLGEYAIAFADLEARCNNNALELQASIDALQDGQ